MVSRCSLSWFKIFNGKSPLFKIRCRLSSLLLQNRKWKITNRWVLIREKEVLVNLGLWIRPEKFSLFNFSMNRKNVSFWDFLSWAKGKRGSEKNLSLKRGKQNFPFSNCRPSILLYSEQSNYDNSVACRIEFESCVAHRAVILWQIEASRMSSYADELNAWIIALYDDDKFITATLSNLG